MKVETIKKIIEQYDALLPDNFNITTWLNPSSGNLEMKVEYNNFFITEEFSPNSQPLDITTFIEKSARYIENMYKAASR